MRGCCLRRRGQRRRQLGEMLQLWCVLRSLILRDMYKIILRNGLEVAETFSDLAAVKEYVALLGLTGYKIKPA